MLLKKQQAKSLLLLGQITQFKLIELGAKVVL
jgi:hypothetical protein